MFIAIFEKSSSILATVNVFVVGFLVVKPGRCPNRMSKKLLDKSCANDEDCPGVEKCCEEICAKPARIGKVTVVTEQLNKFLLVS